MTKEIQKADESNKLNPEKRPRGARKSAMTLKQCKTLGLVPSVYGFKAEAKKRGR